MTDNKILLVVLAAGALVLLSGCERFSFWPNQGDSPPKVAQGGRPIPLHIADTVSEYANLFGGGGMPVHGYGVVIGLGENGSREVPPYLRQYLVQDLLRHKVGLHTAGTGDVSPSRILSDLDTAVVEVKGVIRAGATRDDRFDVTITALPSTGTRSLDGGILMPTELRLDLGSPTPGRGSKIWAMAGGPVMLNPFTDQTDPDEAMKLRAGRIVGGGALRRDRRLSLQLYRPDYHRADIIQCRINARFPRLEPIANAKNPTIVELTIPKAFHSDNTHFLQLIRHLPLNDGPGIWEAHARELAAEMAKPGADVERLALVLEARGRQVISIVRRLYGSEAPAAAFYAARCGVYLGDRQADEVVIRFGRVPGRHQIAAIETLGRFPSVVGGRGALAKLLDAENDRVRIAAYEAMRSLGSHVVVEINVGGQFQLDIVPSGSAPIVYATQTHRPRIALFGESLKITNPVFFSSLGDLVTINALAGAKKLSVWRRIPRAGIISDKFEIPFDLSELITTLGNRPERGPEGDIQGLGLTYGQVVAVLYQLCGQHHIDAKFVLQPLPQIERSIREVESAELRGGPSEPTGKVSGDLTSQEVDM